MKITFEDYLKIDRFFQTKIVEFRNAQWLIFKSKMEECFKPYFDMKKEIGYEDRIDIFDLLEDNSIKEKVISSINETKEKIKSSDFSKYFDITYEDDVGFIDVDIVQRRLLFSDDIDKMAREQNFSFELN
jgi:hypothetical protein